MEWPYSLSVTLSKEQEANRRHLLDAYGQFAQLSVLLLPLLYQLFVALWLLSGRILKRPPHLAKEHRSPTVSSRENSNPSFANGGWKRLKWVLNNEIAPGWGTWQQLLLAFFWASWLLLLAIKDTGDDYLHLTRRFGIIAASQLPIHYVLAMKAWSPVQYITRMSHEELNPYHRLLGRIIVIFMACHAILFTNLYIQKGRLFKRFQDRDVIFGLSAIVSATILFTTALARIRNYSYRLFLYCHVVLSILILPILYLHVTYLRIYILEAAAIYVLLIVQRKISQDHVSATITRYKNTNLVSVSASLRHLTLARSYAPGQHVYLGFPGAKEKLQRNPFTIANHPDRDRQVKIVARVLHGTTSKLGKLVNNQRQPVDLILEGPYGGAKHFPDFSECDSVLLFAGGVGATFILPIYQQLMQTNGADETTCSLRCVWAVRDQADAAWGIERLLSDSGDLPDSFELYLTGERRHKQAPELAAGNDTNEIELQESEGFLSEGTEESRGFESISKSKVRKGRPDLNKLIDDAFKHTAGSKFAVLVCGPTGMGNSVRKEVGRWIGHGRDVFWHNEEFGW